MTDRPLFLDLAQPLAVGNRQQHRDPGAAVAWSRCQAALTHYLILSVQVLQVAVSGRTLSKASYFLRKCGSSPVKVANS